ncbi:reverse transcriptase domain-containing protein [Tanacetum coccineum]
MLRNKAYSTMARAPNNNATTVNSTWTFSHWGINILRPLPTTPGSLKFLAIAVEQSTKWVEAKPLTTSNRRQTENFVWEHIICSFGVPQIITLKDNKQFIEGISADFCKGLKTVQSLSYVTEHVEIMSYIKKQLVRNQQGWVDDLPRILWVHKTLPMNSQNETPFTLTYGSKAIISTVASLTLESEESVTKEKTKRREKDEREIALIKEAYYRNKLRKYHNTMSNHSTFKLGDFVLLSHNNKDRQQQVWKGPHIVSGVYEGDLYKIIDASDYSLVQTAKGSSIRKFYI